MYRRTNSCCSSFLRWLRRFQLVLWIAASIRARDGHRSVATSTLTTVVVNALSSVPPKRPPRIRPGRQSPITPSSDEASYDGGGSSGSSSTNGSTSTSTSGEGSGKAVNNTNNPRNDDNNKSISSKHEQALHDPSLLTTISFSDRTDLHLYTKEALAEGFGLQTMTVVQAATYGDAVEGRSVLARSKTGSGKTLAFLLPVLERLLEAEATGDSSLYNPGRSIGCVVLAPTRELAIQIADQAEVLVEYHNKHRRRRLLKVACLYGGVKMQRDIRLLTGENGGGGAALTDLPTILVSTPSRLLEHLEGNSPLSNKKKTNSNGSLKSFQNSNKSRFASAFAETKIVVLDETDRLLQKSNQRETQRILGFMARTDKRQTLLFSATFPRAVRRLLSTSSILTKQKKETGSQNSRNSKCNGKDYLEVDCVESNDDKKESQGGSSGITNTQDTNQDSEVPSIVPAENRIEETSVVLENMVQFIPTLWTILRREQDRDPQNYKILVFFPAGRLVRFLFQFFTIGGLVSKNGNVSTDLWEIHSRMSQSSRTRASNAFRAAKRGILFSSDVSARGLDYPDVSLVVQMGAPTSDKDYVHRIGRTGRAGKTGRALLVLLPFEESIMNQKQKKKIEKKRNYKRRSSSKMSGTVSYRNDVNLKEDQQLATWLREDSTERAEKTSSSLSSSSSLYQKCTEDLEPTRMKVRSGHVVLTPGAEAAYKTFLAQYVASDRGGGKSAAAASPSPSEIISHAQDFVEGTGLSYTPELDDELIAKLGLKQIIPTTTII